MKTFFALTAFLFSPLAIAAPEATCSSCASYGSPFGPDGGYSYYCFFVERGNQRLAQRFETREECLRSRSAEKACQESEREPRGARRSDPCWTI
jgi:hypothetical protein